MSNNNSDYGKFYKMFSKNKGLIAGLIGGLLALVMVVGVVASAFM